MGQDKTQRDGTGGEGWDCGAGRVGGAGCLLKGLTHLSIRFELR